MTMIQTLNDLFKNHLVISGEYSLIEPWLENNLRNNYCETFNAIVSITEHRKYSYEILLLLSRMPPDLINEDLRFFLKNIQKYLNIHIQYLVDEILELK